MKALPPPLYRRLRPLLWGSLGLLALACLPGATAAAGDAHAASEHGHVALLRTLFVMMLAAKVLAELFERLRQPAVVGEILAGVLIGPQVLGLVEPGALVSTFAEMGVIFLLFSVGLETKPADLFRVGPMALKVAVAGVILPFIAGYGVMAALGHTLVESLFTGAALVATSVGITARVLGGLGLMNLPSSRVILGAAIIDDILGLLVLAVVSGIAATGGVNYAQLGLTTALSLGFVGLVIWVGAPGVTKLAPWVERLHLNHSVFLMALLLCLGLAWAATGIGVAAIIGAFLAGLALAETAGNVPELHHQSQGLTEFFAPFFFVSIGMQLDLGIFAEVSTVALAAGLTVLAMLTKYVAGRWGARGLGKAGARQVGIGMSPRGEVGVVIAQVGLGLGVLSRDVFGAALFVAVATTLIAPPIIRKLFRGERAETPQAFDGHY